MLYSSIWTLGQIRSGKSSEMQGCLWIGFLKTGALGSYIRHELNFFTSSPAVYKTSKEVFGDIRAIFLGVRKAMRNWVKFCESHRILAEKRRNFQILKTFGRCVFRFFFFTEGCDAA